MRNWIVVVTCVPAGTVVFVGTAWLLGSPEIAELRGDIYAAKSVEKTE